MREILCRGKRVDNGEWIEGFYAKSGDRTFILIDNDFAVGYVIMKEVYPETVGEYTGLTDKNGKKIFEGDIIAFRSSESIYEVAYDIADAKFIILLRNGKDSFLRFYNISAYYFSVIANKWDNPDLLEE